MSQPQRATPAIQKNVTPIIGRSPVPVVTSAGASPLLEGKWAVPSPDLESGAWPEAHSSLAVVVERSGLDRAHELDEFFRDREGRAGERPASPDDDPVLVAVALREHSAVAGGQTFRSGGAADIDTLNEMELAGRKLRPVRLGVEVGL